MVQLFSLYQQPINPAETDIYIYLDGKDISQNVFLLCQRLLLFNQWTHLTELAESK
jgi:hypothetical protein